MTKRAGIEIDTGPFDADPAVWGRGGWGRDQARAFSCGDFRSPVEALFRDLFDVIRIAGADCAGLKTRPRIFRELAANPHGFAPRAFRFQKSVDRQMVVAVEDGTAASGAAVGDVGRGEGRVKIGLRRRRS